jgi:diaminohydroxyphosphoribosylaminopyrimidine deaminase/5-amino-6-(5-phosphoribosylamino)uracil reductase
MTRPAGDDASASRASTADDVFMLRALELAERGWGQTAPNPMVGAVVVADGEIVGEGYHARYGGSHAEVAALGAAGAHARGATLYVTLEPCAHQGKTPPCTDAVVRAGVARVVAAVRDPSAIARGGVERLRAAGIAVDVGIQREAALELNAPFFNAHTSDRPWVTLKLALSADGGIADPTGAQRWITGPESRLEVHRLRAGVDAIAVGIGTVLADDPELTVREVPPPRVAPTRVVFDNALRTPLDSRVVRSAGAVRTRLFAAPSAVHDAKAHALSEARVAVEASSSLGEALRALRTDGIRSVLVEGGARLAGSLLAESLVDRLIIFQSQLELGVEALGAFAFAPPGFAATLADRRIVATRRFGDDVMTIYALEDVPCSPD